MTDVENEASPITDWATQFDHTRPEYAAAAPEIWAELRGTCPVAHSDAFGGTYLPTRHDDIHTIAHDTENYTSQGVIVSPWKPEIPRPVGYAPPITSDPPFHRGARRLLLPPFGPKAIAELEPWTRDFCNSLIDDLLAQDATSTDAAVQYAQHIPVQVIAHMLGLPPEDGDKFRGFIHRIIEAPGQEHDIDPEDTLDAYLTRAIEGHRASPKTGDDADLIDFLIAADLDGEPLSTEHIRGSIALLLIAGIDTTWSSIGASIWHLAQHPDDRRRFIDDVDVRPFAIEEFLRLYAPVTMARIVAQDHEINGCPMNEGEWLLLPFPAANRDPEVFDQPDEFVIDRKVNRHAAFGLGIHRCLGSNLARMELSVAIETWLERIPEFSLADPESVRWSTGQIRGPRQLPLTLG